MNPKKNLATKTKSKVEKATAKTKGRVKKAVAKIACALASAYVVAGCMHPGEQAAKSETMNVTIRDSVIAVNIGAKKAAANCTSNTVELAETDRTYDVTILSQAQSLESSGSETFGQTQTPTQDIKPNLDLRYNDAAGTAAGAAKSAATTAAKSSGTLKSLAKEALAATTAATAAVKTDASGAPANLKAKITEFFVDREGDMSKARMYYDADGVLTMTDGTTTVECYPDGACRECGDKS